MSKFVKNLCSLAGTFIFLGIVMLVVGFFMGGRPQGLSIGWNNGPVLRRSDVIASGSGAGVVAPPVNADTIRSLELDIGAAEVEIRTGSEFSLEVTENVPYMSTVENGVWLLSNDGENITVFNGKGPRYILTVPANFSFESVALNIGAGTLEANGLRANEAYASVGAGTMKLNDFKVSGNTDINVGMGTLTMNGALRGHNYVNCGMGSVKLLVERPADYGYDVSNGMGSVKLDGKQTSGVGSDMQGNAGAETFYEIDCGMGSVKVEFSGSATGSIEVPSPPEAPEAPKAPAAPRAPTAQDATENAA